MSDFRLEDADDRTKEIVTFFQNFFIYGFKNALKETATKKIDIMMNVFIGCISNIIFNLLPKDKWKEYIVYISQAIYHNLSLSDKDDK